MNDIVPVLQPATARRIFLWQMLFYAGLLTLSAVSNTFTAVADHAREGDPIQPWRPAVWESTSHLMFWLLIPLQAWLLRYFPITRDGWWRNLPAHLLATVPMSLLHVEGMVLLRRLAYFTVGEHYDFGPFWDNWQYEYRKDFVTYWVFLGGLLAFRLYGLWQDSRAGAPAAGQNAVEAAAPGRPLERLVVRKLNREFILDIGEIDRIEADGNYVTIHAGGQSYRLRESLEGLARRLDEQRFARVHRAHVVNIERIREIQPWDHGDYRIVLKDGSFVNFSRRYRSRLAHLFH